MPFQKITEVPYDYVVNSHFYRSMIKTNGNILATVVGKTRSGKSWLCLSICERWYKMHFKTSYNHENICFSIDELLNRLSSGKLKRGEILILEEGGVNMGSLDFQSKLAQAVNYVLQSFGSLNIGLLVNLPFFSMLNKNTRILMKMLIRVEGVDKKTSLTKFKMNHLDWNQYTGKMWQYKFVVQIGRRYMKIDSHGYPRPSPELVDLYEKRKKEFVLGTIKGASTRSKNPYTATEIQVFYLRQIKGLSNKEVCAILNMRPQEISKTYSSSVNKGLTDENVILYENYYRNLVKVPAKSYMPAI